MRLAATISVMIACWASSEAAVVHPERDDESPRYGCLEKVTAEAGEEVKRPRKKSRFRRPLSTRELDRWGPIEVSGMVGCDGRLHDLKFDRELPEKIETKLRKVLGKSRYQPATLGGSPVAVYYTLVLERPEVR